MGGSNNTILGAYRGVVADASLSDTVIISAGPTERMRIDEAGNVLIGDTLPDAPNISLNENGSAEFTGAVNVLKGASGVTTDTSAALTVEANGATDKTQGLSIYGNAALQDSYSGFALYKGTAEKARINYDGSAIFAGTVSQQNFQPTTSTGINDSFMYGASNNNAVQSDGEGRSIRFKQGWRKPSADGATEIRSSLFAEISTNSAITNKLVTEAYYNTTFSEDGVYEFWGNDSPSYIYSDGSATFAADVNIHGVTVGRGGGSVVTNTSVGRTALFDNTTGSHNTALGRDALRFNTGGNNNTAVGNSAGYHFKGNNNTILGSYVGTEADATLNDTVIISAGVTERLRINSTGNVLIGDTLPLDPNISLNADGSAEFAAGGFNVDPNGRISVKRNDDLDVSYVFIIKDSSDTETIRFRARGDAEFAGGDISLNGDGSATFNSTVKQGDFNGGRIDATGSVLLAAGGIATQYEQATTASTARAFRVYHGTSENATVFADGSATFTGDITANNVTFNLEPDNDANYTTTTEEYTETESYTGTLGNTLEREVTKTRDIRTYTGPTLDVKDRLQNVLSRIDAIEANEVADDATDSALLQLVASLTARLDEKDEALASLTATISALTDRVTTLES